MEMDVNMIWNRRKEYEQLNRMLDDALAGNFNESMYDESELSKLQTKWKRYLVSKELSEKKINDERNNLKELITNISHQSKTLLTSIVLYAQLLQESIDNDISREYADELIIHTNKLEALLQSLVKMSRLEAGVYEYVIRRTFLTEFAAEMVKLAKAGAANNSISLISDINEGDELLTAFDGKWTTEAVNNILDNAIKYSAPETEVEVSVFHNELFNGIQIKDNGPGIPEEEIPAIFGRFYRGRDVHDQSGIGVGLYLAREIIEGQGGYIKVSSKEGEGSTFRIYLPI